MRAVSQKFLSTLSGAHKIVSRATVCTTFQTGTSPTGTEISIVDGNVRSVTNGMIRSTLDLTTGEPWPTTQSDLITPYGNEIYVERGIEYGNGQREWVGLGYFRIDTPEQDEVPDGPVQITAPDRMQGIVDARFLTPRQFPGNMSRGDLVTTLITEVYPSAVISWDDTDYRDAPIGRPIIVEQDRAKCLMDLVTAMGKIGYWRYDGVFRIETPPDITGEASWTINAGEDGVLVRLSRSLTRAGAHNAYVCTGEAGDTTPPARGVAIDNNPLSPTYFYGDFGQVPEFFSSPFLTTDALATTSARTLLSRSIGIPYQVRLTNIVNPAVEPYDVLVVSYPDRGRNRSLQSEIHVVDECVIPLVESRAQDITTREQLVQLIGTGE